MLGRKIIASIAVFAAVGLCAFADTVTMPMSNPSWGYTVTGLGNGNEVALVFTNHLDATMTWTVPRELENVQFLVVGGGGGGGADSDNATGAGYGGAGGGGGGVITGYVNSALAEGTVVNVTVGAGGAGGKLGESDGASEKGDASSLVVDGIAIVYADGGGNDGGYPNPGGAGGSNGGWRTNADKTVDDPNSGSSYVAQVVTAVMYGNSGGKGYSTAPASSGGGGGAMTAGSPSMSSTNEDNPFYNQDPQRNIAGQGGEGLSSDITGTAVVYGSGGGGGNATTGKTGLAAVGGTNAGNGAGKNGTTADYDSSNPVTSSNGGDGVANCGGGGGGAGNNSSDSDGNGGNGGSGIVVIRYVDPTLHAHSWSAWTTNAPTCTSDGSRSRTCTACTSEPAATETEVLPALGHNIVIDVDSDGGLVRKCSRCDYSYTASSGWGYKVTGVGTYGNEVALVFTNHTETTSWYVPENLQNVQFLVVGGGGGGGGDSNVNAGGQGGAGGGGGGVITGYVYSVSSGATVAVAVGQGGEGGAASTTSGSNEGDGAAVKGAASSFSIDGTVMVSADGGGRDLGAYSTSEESGGVGGYGGSNAGSRTESHSSTDPNYKSVINNDYVFGEMFGGQGGVAYTEGAYAAGGGGGATEDGGASVNSVDGSSFWQAGKGGEGLASSITGTEVVYGSGGGGGSGYNKDLDLTAGGAGGDGAGDGSKSGDGGDAVANRGGGGGGGGDQGSGGNGGSGIVVLCYVDATAHAHVFNDWTTTVYPSCTTSGERIRTCQNCDSSPAYVQIEEISALGHDWGEWVTNTSATCTQDGLARRVCNRSGCFAEETQVIPAIGHNYSSEPYLVVEPKFSNYPSHDGVGTNYYCCAGCNAIKEETISALGYVRTGLGESKREVAVVFTNENAGAMTWTVPQNLRNIQFLVVGGGGGGSGGTWGPGGGGGGVATGEIYRLTRNMNVRVDVGSGGKPGTSNTGDANRGHKGGASYVEVDGEKYIIANGGGARGTGGRGSSYATGGSGAGGGACNNTFNAGGAADPGEVNDSFAAGNAIGNPGGNNDSNNTSSGGGGGATAPGNNADGKTGGAGGEGLACDITGTSVIYGSGGGGGGSVTRGSGGSGAGSGGSNSKSATSAAVNRGGGGGGGGPWNNPGGAGGSGIVVFRYTPNPPVFKVIVR